MNPLNFLQLGINSNQIMIDINKINYILRNNTLNQMLQFYHYNFLFELKYVNLFSSVLKCEDHKLFF